jgi:hypothetical protein
MPGTIRGFPAGTGVLTGEVGGGGGGSSSCRHAVKRMPARSSTSPAASADERRYLTGHTPDEVASRISYYIQEIKYQFAAARRGEFLPGSVPLLLFGF